MFDPFDASGESWQTLYAAIDLAPFRSPADPRAARAAVGLPGDAFVLGHVGRFAAEKNHAFLVQVAAEVARREPRTHLLLIGDGPLRPAIMQQVADAGLAERVVFAGLRADVPCLLRAMDVLVLPSTFEGLSLVGLEAQAAGVPWVASDIVPVESVVVPALVQRLPLHLPAAAWAEALLAARASISQPEALALLEHSPFNIRVSVAALERIYADARTTREARTGYARA